ncbi:MAG TPA: glutathione S-transferase domain-containing protein [Solirubrobacteraceae bacterium]
MPALVGILLTPVVPAFVWRAGASDERVRCDLAELPELLDEVDRLLEIGVIGGEELGAADFQIASTVRMLLAMGDVRRLVTGRPAELFAERVVPDYPDIPAALPADWLPTVA